MTHSIAPRDFFSNFGEFAHHNSAPVTVHAHRFTNDNGRIDQLVVINGECEVSIEDVPALVNAILAARDAVVVVN